MRPLFFGAATERRFNDRFVIFLLKGECGMDWLTRMNRAIDYIDENLDGAIDYDFIASLACCSTYQFAKMFSVITDIPLSEYIRRRRLTRAALELQTSDIKVIDLGLKYGYDSPTAFNRAFQNMHGLAPSAARKKGVFLKSYPRITFQFSIKGDEEMKYRIEEKAAFRAVGFKQKMSIVNGENLDRIPKMWANLPEADYGKLCAAGNAEPKGLLGICANFNGEEFDYYIACATTLAVPEEMSSLEIPQATWAIFESVGPLPDAIQNLTKRIFSEWLPSSGYEQDDVPQLEVFSAGDIHSADYVCEVWFPIRK